MLTTEKLLKMQDAGDVIFDYTPLNLTVFTTVESMQDSAPNVDPALISAWFDYVQAKEKLTATIKELRKNSTD